MVNILRVSVCISSVFALSAIANVYHPSEFSDFFSEVESKIHIVVAGDNNGDEITAVVNYDTFKIVGNSSSEVELRHFLKTKSIKNNIIDGIINDAIKGISTDSECITALNTCVLGESENKTSRYVFDFDNSVLKIFIPATAVENNAEFEYVSPFSQESSLINWSNLYAYTNFDGEEQINFSNLTTIGLPLGFLTFDTQYQSQDSEFDIYAATYDVEFKGNRILIGRNYYNPSFNSTDFFNNGATLAGDSFLIGSSSNLLKGKKDLAQKIYFYAPQNGQLEVRRGNQLILNKVIGEGKQFISYDDLPKGAYEVTITLKAAGDQVIFTEKRQIVNNNKFSLLTGDFDYVFGFGKLDNYLDDYATDYDSAYGKFLINYRLAEHITLGAGVTSDKNDQMYQLGGSLFWGDNLSIDYSASLFSESELYQTARLSFSPFFIDFSKFDYNLDDISDRLSSQLYSQENYQNIGVGLSGNLFKTLIYLRYGLYSTDYRTDPLASSTRSLDQKVISGGLSRKLWDGYLSLNIDYFDNDFGDVSDYLAEPSQLQVNLTWTYEFGDGISSQVSANGDRNGFVSNTNYLRAEKVEKNWYSNLSAGATVDKDFLTLGDFSATFVGETDYINVNGYGYLNDEGVSTFSGGLSGTQIVSSTGVDFTKEKSRSFLLIDKEVKQMDEQQIGTINYSLAETGRRPYRTEFKNDRELVKLEDYRDIELTIDESGHNVDIDGKKYKTFSHPGTVNKFSTKIATLLSQILVLDDINGKPITHAQCIGDGCVNIEPLSEDGVYRVNYRHDKPYRIISRKGLCIYESSSEEAYAKGYCLPGLEKEKTDTTWQETSQLFDDNESNKLLVYLGKFKENIELDKIIDDLNRLSISFKKLTVNSEVYIYILHEREFNQAQRKLLQELDAYVLLRSSEIDLLTINSSILQGVY